MIFQILILMAAAKKKKILKKKKKNLMKLKIKERKIYETKFKKEMENKNIINRINKKV